MRERPGIKAIWTLEPAKGVSDDTRRLTRPQDSFFLSTIVVHDRSPLPEEHSQNVAVRCGIQTPSQFAVSEFVQISGRQATSLFLIVVSIDVVCERVWCFACLLACLVSVALPLLLGGHQHQGCPQP
jgi:hypothetical protein